MEDEEKWKQIENYSKYEISDRGGLHSIKSQRDIKQQLYKGYYRVHIFNDDNKQIRNYIHDLVALHCLVFDKLATLGSLCSLLLYFY